jgi:nucleotide-binding universal stress UspA family protein
MAALATPTRAPASVGAPEHRLPRPRPANATPIVAAVDDSSASRGVVQTAVRLAAELNLQLVFVYVRRGPPGFLGTPFFQRRLTAKMTRARRAVDRALSAAAQAGVDAESEILEGAPRTRILQLASDRDAARLIVVGSRRRRFSRSVSCGVLRAAEGPVVVAGSRPLLADVR